jgi:hypothetical protein
VSVDNAGLLAQVPDYGGTWKLNRDASRIADGVGITELGAAGAPPTLYISQAANGTVVIGSDINESHARTFRMVNGAIATEGAGVKVTVSVSADRQTLTVTATRTAPAGRAATTTLVYTRAHVEDPCEK